MRRRTFRVVSTLGVVALAVPLATAQPSGAEDTAFSAEAIGAAMRVTTFFDKAPGTSTPFEGPGPVAHAALDAFGSGAFASFPYPGAVAVGGGSLAAGLIPGFPSPPAYPFHVASSYPLTPTAEQKMGTVDLAAHSTATSSDAAATANQGQDGQGVGALVANALSATHDGEVSATAAGAVTAFAAGPLSLGKVSATASIKLDRAGRMVKKSTLEISAARVGDVAFGIGPAGFVLPGSATPMPKEGMEQLLGALAKAGLEVHYVAARETADSISSASLEVRQDLELPNGKNTVTWMLGQASARITTAMTEAEQSGGGITGTPGSTGAAAPAVEVVAADPPAAPTGPPPAAAEVSVPVGRSGTIRSGGVDPEAAPYDPASPADDAPAEVQLLAGSGRAAPVQAAPVASSTRYVAAPYAVLGLGAMLFAAGVVAGGARRRRTA